MLENNCIQIKSVAVIGGGLMGHGIAQDFATSGIPVKLWDTSEEKLTISIENIKKNMHFLGQNDLIDDVVELITPVSAIYSTSILDVGLFSNILPTISFTSFDIRPLRKFFISCFAWFVTA